MIRLFSIAITLLFSTRADAVNLAVGQRAYSAKPKEVFIEGQPQKRELGAGTIAWIYPSGSIVFYSDNFGANELKEEDLDSIEPRIPLEECRISPNEIYYSRANYDSQTREQREVGLVTVKEVFADCRSGRAVIVAAAADAPKMVPMISLLREVKCPFSGKHVYSKIYGPGIVKQVYGDCRKGTVLFRADRDSSASVAIPVSSIMQRPD